MVSKIKIDDTFPETQFCVEGFYTPYGRVSTSQGGGILLYVREDITSKLIKHSFEDRSEGLFIEMA